MNANVLTLFIFLAASSTTFAARKVVCYYGSWSVYRPGDGAFKVEDIQANLCSHLIYAFVGIEENGAIKILDPNNDVQHRAFERFTNLKSKNHNLKTIVAVGGWGQGSERYSRMAANPASRANFIRSAMNLMNQYHFDGFDIDWEYPTQRGGVAQDKANFVTLLKEFRNAIGKRLLSVAVGATPSLIQSSYDVPSIAKYVDFINVMTYDMHGAWDGVTGANAPLYAKSGPSVSQCIEAWISHGAPPSKVIMGIPIYGRTFTLSDPNKHGMGAPAAQPGQPGPFTKEPGTIGYNEMCLELQKNHWTVVWDDAKKVPYAFRQNQWVSYDNQRSVEKKMEFIKQKNLGGAMVWSIETDDFRGKCGKKYPILSAINHGL